MSFAANVPGAGSRASVACAVVVDHVVSLIAMVVNRLALSSTMEAHGSVGSTAGGMIVAASIAIAIWVALIVGFFIGAFWGSPLR
jgi:hypothetical protein